MIGQINKIIKDYQLDVEAITEAKNNTGEFSIKILLGNNEGYYVTIADYSNKYSLRIHDQDEALKALGCMLTLLPKIELLNQKRGV